MNVRVGPPTKAEPSGDSLFSRGEAEAAANLFCGGMPGAHSRVGVGWGGVRGLLAVWGASLSANEPLSAWEGDFLRWASLGEGTAALALGHVPLTPGSPGLQVRPRVIPGYGLPLKSEDGAKSGREQRAVWVPLGFILRDGGRWRGGGERRQQ